MDRRRRYYSAEVLPVAPGGIHHPDCPCCRIRERVEDGCRQAVSMNGAGLSRETIERELGRWLDRYETSVVMQFHDGALPGAPLTHRWEGNDEPTR